MTRQLGCAPALDTTINQVKTTDLFTSSSNGMILRKPNLERRNLVNLTWSVAVGSQRLVREADILQKRSFDSGEFGAGDQNFALSTRGLKFGTCAYFIP